MLIKLINRHRSSKVEPELRLQKLRGFIDPVQALWQNPQMNEALLSFGNFCDLLYLSNTRDYLVSRHVHDIQEWGLYQLDTEGQSVQKQLEDRLKVTREFLQTLLWTYDCVGTSFTNHKIVLGLFD